MKYDQLLSTAVLIVAMILVAMGTFAFIEWRRFQRRKEEREVEDRAEAAKRRDEELAIAQRTLDKQNDLDSLRIALDRERIEAESRRRESEESYRYQASRAEEERAASNNSGAGSGGFHLVTISESDRSLFHDLLKGFEDYAKLKGYRVSFSIDNSWEGRTAYKFTVQGSGIVVGSEQVREDFREYVDRVRKDEDTFEDIPVVTSMAEHHLLVTMLRNRIEFFRTNYKLYKNTVTLFETLIANNRFFPAQSQPSVIVHTGGQMDSRSWNATNSRNLNMGDQNQLADMSINIGGSVNEKMERISALDNVIGKLKASETKTLDTEKAERSLSKVRDELADEAEPNHSMIKKWLEVAKNTLGSAALGYETLETSRKLWELFGL